MGEHDSRRSQDRTFDAHVAERMRRAIDGMDLPTSSAAEAMARGRRIQRRSRLAAGGGVLVMVVAAVGVAVAVQPLGTADVVQPPPWTASVPGSEAPAACPSATPIQQSTEPPGPEAGLDPAGIEGWALLFAEQPWSTGEQVKVVWRLSGTGDPTAVAVGPSGVVVEPDDLVRHGGSNWDRPGDEWGTIWTFDQAGCWELRVTRDQGFASLQVEVSDPAGTATPASDCAITFPTGDFTPPAPYPDRPVGDGQVWYGTEDLWTVLPLDGEYGPRKSVWWSTHFQGGQAEPVPDITVTWRRLNGPEPTAITFDGPGTNAYTDEEGWWMIAGLDPDMRGCWEVTATYRDAELSYTYWYEDDTGLPSPARSTDQPSPARR